MPILIIIIIIMGIIIMIIIKNDIIMIIIDNIPYAMWGKLNDEAQALNQFILNVQRRHDIISCTYSTN